MNISLNDNWKMNLSGSDEKLDCAVPCSVYKTLLEHKKIPDIFYGENEYELTKICDDDYDFTKKFTLSDDIIGCEHIYLRFDGIDTLSEVYLNSTLLGSTDNMHRTWEYDIKSIAKAGANLLEVKTKSPNKYIAKKQAERPLWGVFSTMEGYPHIRKSHCMLGWDWGPKLPDMGIWRNVTLEYFGEGRILDIHYTQEHTKACVMLNADIHIENYSCDKAILEVYSPQGELVAEKSVSIDNTGDRCSISVDIDEPQLWWANGYGEHPLYNCKVRLISGDTEVDENTQRIGLRTITISQEPDEWGSEFCFMLNGKKIFAMGANYVPEEHLIACYNEERTRFVLEQCKKANYNFLRAWGGGNYPEDYFYDFCDENGIIVWQDFMFACSEYSLADGFRETVIPEIRDNIIRLRNHASLGLWCGNNEVEFAWLYWDLPDDAQTKADYLELFEDIIPNIVNELSPEVFYWPSSPSSGGGFNDPAGEGHGDKHYWEVWHSYKPMKDYRYHYYRFCSEYGFESLPSIKTIRAFADDSKSEFNLMSPAIESHQKCYEGNEKVMFYLGQLVKYPYSFEELIYLSQFVQAESIRTNVEHMRRSRGRCMGSCYWQVNDSNPIISWSSIDYFNRWKGLHYYARRFYEPILLSVDDSDPKHPIFNVSNETMNDFSGRIVFNLRNNKSEILYSGSIDIDCPSLCAVNAEAVDISKYLSTRDDIRTSYLEYRLERNGEVISKNSILFVRPKEFIFAPAKVEHKIVDTGDEFEITLRAENYAKSVCLDLTDADAVFSDNWFDIHGNEAVTITINKSDISCDMTKDELEKQLNIRWY